MDMIDTSKATAAAPALNPTQWAALGRMADRYAQAEELGSFAVKNLGGEMTEAVLTLTELVQDPKLLPAVRELLATLVTLYEVGALRQLRDNAILAAEGLRDTDLNATMTQMLKLPDRISAVIDQASQASDEKHLGGFGGLMHMLRDKEVQHGIQTLARMAGALNNNDPDSKGAAGH
ncbi:MULTISPECIES: hypothetical protein [unclassified Thiomonas]|uniref:hypothetical protein n=1 Tax=unclassified Thiomonas TaxID=2625466 RepID=UPI0004DBACB9|nr:MULTISPECIES: hypothetical protein [unclassified Thiomonas]MDD4999651.1 hypothetical protein [Thiomonas arsenitoxydans]CQR41954.1 conserved hypothetical protein [Thiomonas sp. CB3]CDW95463.1 conserved hypothetical protein [Thiomonas sp. CB2]VDY03564.1 conserved protein of unknown function [Thiomonas sp. Bio17B3]VDY09260.1 conserved protein of unknown function [Thiomonas sp. Sup16B3]